MMPAIHIEGPGAYHVKMCENAMDVETETGNLNDNGGLARATLVT